MFSHSNLLKLPFRSTSCLRKISTSAKLCKIHPISMVYQIFGEEKADPATPPLIIMHGLFGSKRNWITLSRELNKKTSPRRRIIAVDARNHGESPDADHHTYSHMVEDIRELYANLDLAIASVLGHSMGGRAVMYFALNYPEMVEKLIVVDVSPVGASPNLESMPGLIRAMDQLEMPHGVSMAEARKMLNLQMGEVISDKCLRAFLLTNLERNKDGSFKWQINLQALLKDFYDHIARFPEVENMMFTGPTLFIAGADSNYIDQSDHNEIQTLFPQANFVEIGDAGHWLHQEKPGEFLDLCLNFLNSESDSD